MTAIPFPSRHADMTEFLVRRPGIPPSGCCCELLRVDAEQSEIPWDSPGFFDSCLRVEGELWQFSEIFLFLCRRSRNTLVVAVGPDGIARLRNDHPRVAWDRAVARPVDEGEPAAVA